LILLQKNKLFKQSMLQQVKLEDMIQSGMHFGHFTREWNPRMAPYIYGERNGRHILDLVQTYYLLNKVLNFLEENAAKGKTFLFVGTKKQAAPLIAKTALGCNSYYVNQRWLGGMLTNWRTIQKSLRKLQEYRQAEERGDWNLLKKQEVARKRREKDRLEKYLSGLENMSKLPGVVIIIGQTEEIHAVKECRQLGIPTVTLLDSNCDPSLADWFIPANDDSVSALRLLLSSFQEAIQTGQTRYREREAVKSVKQNSKQISRRRFSPVTKKSKPGDSKRLTR
jgi:small subunit ribosomal protein S2